ncbi:MAG: CDP-glucose 4,6-dehydratase [Legionellales bacterium]|nr:CDP-glucose 4,6-dehydratase [Legionellales bacterium]
MDQFNNIYRGKKVLLTGHTGFKGSWMALWLKELGAEVFGISLPPEGNLNHWVSLKLDIKEKYIDIRDSDKLIKAIQEFRPDIVFHLAAQSLVRHSYYNPLETWGTNVMGTANVLEACCQTNSVSSVVVITTDKCYENKEWLWGYRENDRLGGHDPYSASKAATEILAASYRKSFFAISNRGVLLATCRSGNVIGGGDWSENRLIPDLVRAMKNNKLLEIRSPKATRPWQHVLEPLSGYLLLGSKLLESKQEFAQAWNFGPGSEGNLSVECLLKLFKQHWAEITWNSKIDTELHEANLLQLDCTKANVELEWLPVLGTDRGIELTIDWYKHWLNNKEIISKEQLDYYINQGLQSNISWIKK